MTFFTDWALLGDGVMLKSDWFRLGPSLFGLTVFFGMVACTADLQLSPGIVLACEDDSGVPKTPRASKPSIQTSRFAWVSNPIAAMVCKKWVKCVTMETAITMIIVRLTVRLSQYMRRRHCRSFPRKSQRVPVCDQGDDNSDVYQLVKRV